MQGEKGSRISPEWADWVYVGADNFGDAPSEKVPDDDATIITAYSK